MELENVNGKANVGVTLGAIGTGLAVLGMHGGLGGLFGMGGGVANAAASLMGGQSAPISRYELDMALQIAKKDSEIALLSSEQNTEVKMTQVYERLATRLLADEKEQAAWNAQQGINNATMSAAIASNAASIAALQNVCSSITKTVVPNSSVCPGWGAVNITPTASTATTTTINQ